MEDLQSLASRMIQASQRGQYISPFDQWARQQEEAKPSVLQQVAGTAYQWSTSSAMRFLRRYATTPDPQWQPSADELSPLLDGLPPEYHDNIFEARSREEAELARDQYLELIDWQQRLSKAGWSGKALQFGVSFVDPGFLAVGAVSGGLGTMAGAAGKAGRLGQMAKAGYLDAAASTALASWTAQDDPAQDTMSIAALSMAGFGVTKGVSTLVGNKLSRLAFKMQAKQDIDDANTLMTGQPVVRSFSAHSPRTMEEMRQAANMEALSASGKRVLGTEAAQVVSEVKATDVVDGDELLDGAIDSGKINPPVVDIPPPPPPIDPPTPASPDGPPPPPPKVFGDYTAPEAIDAPMEMAAVRTLGKLGSFSASTLSSPLKSIRMASSVLFENAVGFKDAVQKGLTADQAVKRLYSSKIVPLTEAFDEAAKSVKKGVTWLERKRVEDELFAGAGRLLHDAGGNPSLYTKAQEKVANAVSAHAKEMLRFAKAHQIKGADLVPENENYLPRTYLHKPMVNDHGTYKKDFENFWRDAVKSGAKKNGIDLGDDYALVLAKAILREARETQGGMESAFAKFIDADRIRELLGPEGLSKGDIEKVVSLLGSKEGGTTNFRRRITLDEGFDATMPDGRVLKISDYLENDVRRLMRQYTQHIVSAAVTAEANRSIGKALGREINSLDDLLRAASDEGVEARLSPDQIAKELRPLQIGYEAISGVRGEADRAYAQWLRRLRSLAFIGRSGMFGIAQLGEFGNVAGEMSARGLSKVSPAWRDIITGKAGDGPLKEFLLAAGVGFDKHTHDFVSRLDDDLLGTGHGTGFMAGVDRMLDKGVRLASTYNGMYAIDAASRKMAAVAAGYNIAANATKRQLELVGIDAALHGRILEQIKKYPTNIHIDGTDLPFIAINKWDDLEAANAFMSGVTRWANRTVQDASIGSRLYIPLVSPEVAKSLLQFRSFATAAYEKQTLYKISALQRGELDQFMAIMWTSMLAGGAYAARTHLQAVGMDEEKRAEFLSSRLSMERIGAAMYAQSGFASVTPMMMDTTLSLLGEDQWFAPSRNSGLGGDIITGNPSYAMFRDATRATAGIGGAANNLVTGRGSEFSQSDLRAVKNITPFNTFMPVPWGFNKLSNLLPEE